VALSPGRLIIVQQALASRIYDDVNRTKTTVKRRILFCCNSLRPNCNNTKFSARLCKLT